MDSGPLRVSALLELAALQAVHGEDRVTLDNEFHQELIGLAAAGALEEAAAAAHLGTSDLPATIRLGASTDHQRADRSLAGSSHDVKTRRPPPPPPLELELRVRLPPAYGSPPPPATLPSAFTTPGVAASAVSAAAVRCSVSAICCCTTGSGGGGVRRRLPSREWVDELTAELACLAQDAAAEVRPCLHELVETAQAALDELAAAEAAEANDDVEALQVSSGGGGGGGGVSTAALTSAAATGRDGPDDDALQVLLLRLDHMHNRTLYGRTIGSWIRELRLTGRLIFQGNLILILLEGDGAALREYLVRHRTESVDVDSRGRKCKERMMDVIVQQPLRQQHPEQRQQGRQQQQQDRQAQGRQGRQSATGAAAVSAAAGHSSTTTITSGGGLRAFSDYRESQLDTLEQVGQLLRRVGLEDWLRPAAGLQR